MYNQRLTFTKKKKERKSDLHGVLIVYTKGIKRRINRVNIFLASAKRRGSNFFFFFTEKVTRNC